MNTQDPKRTTEAAPPPLTGATGSVSPDLLDFHQLLACAQESWKNGDVQDVDHYLTRAVREWEWFKEHVNAISPNAQALRSAPAADVERRNESGI